MTMPDVVMQTDSSNGPLGLLLVDGPNVMIKIKELWDLAEEHRPSNFGLRYDAVAEYLRNKFGVLPGNFQKTIFIKKVSDAASDDDSLEKQDKFRYALERDGWDVQVRAQAEGTQYGEKENDIDDDLIGLAEKYLEEAEENDVLIIMTNDFAPSPSGSSTKRVLENAAKLNLRTAVVAFKPIAPELHRGRFEVIDSRDIPGAYEVPPPLPRTIADVKPGTIESFDRHAVKVVGRRPSKLATDDGKQTNTSSQQPAGWSTGESGSPRRVIPPPPRPTHGNRSIPTPPRTTDSSDLRHEILGAPVLPSSTWVR